MDFILLFVAFAAALIVLNRTIDFNKTLKRKELEKPSGGFWDIPSPHAWAKYKKPKITMSQGRRFKCESLFFGPFGECFFKITGQGDTRAEAYEAWRDEYIKTYKEEPSYLKEKQ